MCDEMSDVVCASTTQLQIMCHNYYEIVAVVITFLFYNSILINFGCNNKPVFINLYHKLINYGL